MLLRTLKFLVLAGLLFSLVSGCASTSKENVVNNEAILNYLEQKIMLPVFGGKISGAYEILGKDSKHLYIWAFLQEFYEKDGGFKKGSAMSSPIVLLIKNGNEIAGHNQPRDGSFYREDVQRLFPAELQKVILTFPNSKKSDLEKRALQRAQWLPKNSS